MKKRSIRAWLFSFCADHDLIIVTNDKRELYSLDGEILYRWFMGKYPCPQQDLIATSWTDAKAYLDAHNIDYTIKGLF